VRFLRTSVFTLIVLGFCSFLVLRQSAIAASPEPMIGLGDKESKITLEKIANTNVITLGQVVSYTVTIKNNGTKTIEPKLIDILPHGLILKANSVSQTIGLATAENNTVSWSSNLMAGEKAVIYYSAIPPSTSSADQKLVNIATLQVNETVLEAQATITTLRQNLGMWESFIHFINLSLVYLQTLLAKANIPYSFGFAIILFTVLVRLLTYPLNMQQIKSSKAMQELQPKMKELQEKYKNDREALAMAQMTLYKEAGVNPLGGCLPMLVQMPIWIALYWSLIQLSDEGLLSEGFFWIPSLAGPVAYHNGGFGWLWPLPPSIGWVPALSYLVLPVLLTVSQFYMQQMMTPASDDPQQQSMQSMMKFMPLMFGYFSLIVPSGLTLYWFTSNLLMLVQQYFTQPPVSNPILVKAKGETISSSPTIAPKNLALSTDTNSSADKKGKHARTKRKPKHNS